MTTWDEEAAVVIDNGSGVLKAGFAGEDAPAVVFGTCIGHPKKSTGGDLAIGDDALSEDNKGKYKISYPIEHGIVNNFDELEKIWEYAFKELKVESDKQAMLLTEAALNPKVHREKMIELAFEKFKAPASYIVVQAVMSLYSGGRETGVVVDCGDGITHIVPVWEGFTCRKAILRNETAGRDLTEFMMDLLTNDCDHPFTTSSDREVARQIKENLCFVSKDFEDDLVKIENDISCYDEEYELPDGKVLYIGRPRFACPEALFDPELMGREEIGIHKLTAQSINMCDLDIRKELWNNIVLSGGSTHFEGFVERMTAELETLAPPNAPVKVLAPPERKYSVWMGAAILASLSSFTQSWITKSDYEEAGAAIIHRRVDTLVNSISDLPSI
eukprot:TRINITY_DN26665_c0_g1_i1.p1 TRINITY_DN26665_c0_g1~~TRINITY_DN26665_c0_g1_i1.p1  ORF type:complete len:387 (-),score=34.99 TRINITY_DN26665_c0_g1_i1:90-1250(-)